MSKRARLALALLVALVVAGMIYLPGLYRRVVGLRRMPSSAEVERRAVLEPPVSTATDATQEARMFWASTSTPGTLKETDIELKLSADPVERGKQLLAALISGPSDPNARTLPPGASLLEFYLLPGGVAVADFSSDLGTQLPSGIQSEDLAVESVAETLAANIPNLSRLKILIDGQEAQTLAGHVDLTGYFVLQAPSTVAMPLAHDSPTALALTDIKATGKLNR